MSPAAIEEATAADTWLCPICAGSVTDVDAARLKAAEISRAWGLARGYDKAPVAPPPTVYSDDLDEMDDDDGDDYDSEGSSDDGGRRRKKPARATARASLTSKPKGKPGRKASSVPKVRSLVYYTFD
jgi:hypothetical protein